MNMPSRWKKLGAMMDQSRPSGPYTLQCMMPNVASGRAALQLDLNGPNFVVDGGDHSLEAAFDSARLLLGKRQSHEQLLYRCSDSSQWTR